MTDTRVIFGFHTVLARLRQLPASVHEIYLDRSDQRARQVVVVAQSKSVRVIEVERPRLDGMCGHQRHQGVAARVSVKNVGQDLDEILDALTVPPLLLVLDGIQDPHNLGACLRVADAAGVHAVIAPKDRAVGLTAIAAKVASGAADSVKLFTVTNLARTLRELKERNIWLLGASEDAERDLFAARLVGPIAWVMGGEGRGLRRLTRELCDELVRIPMYGAVESLNVSVASGICLYESLRQRAGTG